MHFRNSLFSAIRLVSSAYLRLLIFLLIFAIFMSECESWTIRKGEHWRIDTSKLWCWKRLLRVPWTARRSNQSVLKEINPVYSLLKLQYFGHLMWRADSLEKTLVPGKVEGKRRRGWQSMRWLDKHHQLNAHVLGATTGDPTHDKGHAERTWQAKAEPDSEGFPGSARASTLKLKSVCVLFIILCFSPTLLTFTGGYPQPPFSEENQLRALVTKSPGLERSIFTLTHLLLF